MYQYVSKLKFINICQLNAALTRIRSPKPHLYFKSRQEPLSNRPELLKVLSSSDAASGTSSYGQTGSLTGLIFESKNRIVYHHIDWHSSKQNRFSCSSAGAEILPAAYTADREIHMSKTLAYIISMNGHRPPPDSTLLVDSNALSPPFRLSDSRKIFHWDPRSLAYVLSVAFKMNLVQRAEYHLSRRM